MFGILWVDYVVPAARSRPRSRTSGARTSPGLIRPDRASHRASSRFAPWRGDPGGDPGGNHDGSAGRVGGAPAASGTGAQSAPGEPDRRSDPPRAGPGDAPPAGRGRAGRPRAAPARGRPAGGRRPNQPPDRPRAVALTGAGQDSPAPDSRAFRPPQQGRSAPAPAPP